MEKLRKKLEDVEKLMEKWVETKPQVTEEERKGILDQVKKIQKWADDNEKKQDKKKPHEDPVFLSTDIPEQFVPLEKAVVKLGKKPMPKIVKKENATDSSSNSTSTTKNATDDSASNNSTAKSDSSDSTGSSDETASEEPSKDETKISEEASSEDIKETGASEEATSADDVKEPVKEEL
jgi:hypothetical protein